MALLNTDRSQWVLSQYQAHKVVLALDEHVPVRGGVDLVDAGHCGHLQAHLVHWVSRCCARQGGRGGRLSESLGAEPEAVG